MTRRDRNETHPRALTAPVRVLLVELAGLGLSQLDSARRAGIDSATLSRWLSAGRTQRDERGLKPRRFDSAKRRWEPQKKTTSALVELVTEWEHARVGSAMDAVQTLRLAAAGKLDPIRTVTVHEEDGRPVRTIKKVEQQAPSIEAAKWIAERLLPDSFAPKTEQQGAVALVPPVIKYVLQPVEPDAVPTVIGAPMVVPEEDDGAE